MTLRTSRRGFLAGVSAALGALVVGLDPRGAWAQADGGMMPNPFVRVGADGRVTVILKHFEMGREQTIEIQFPDPVCR